MSLFDNVLGDKESVFRDPIALDYDYIPKLVPYREKEQFQMADCIKPLFQKRNGRNLLIIGRPGVGKTVACKHVIRELEEKTDDIMPIYINCWQKNTTFKIILEMCNSIGFRFTQNKKTNELFNIVKQELNKKSVVFVFDEIDKAEDFDFLYTILEEIYRKSVILISSDKQWGINLDERIRSRLIPETIEFNHYKENEVRGILKQRCKYAFVADVLEESAFESIVSKIVNLRDLRSGLYLLREAGNAAEEKASKTITQTHVETAIQKLDKFSIKNSDDLEDETKFILDLVKKNPEVKIGELFKNYEKRGGKSVYKTFKRKIVKLQEGGFVTVKTITGGTKGSTSIISQKKIEEKKLTDY